MIAGLGIDVVNISRIEHWLTIEGLPERFFHKNELALAYKNPKTTALTLAARFAAKEAFGKALGTGLRNIKLRDICVINEPNGKPNLFFEGTAKIALELNGAEISHVSLTHEKKVAIAVVLLEKIV